MVSDQLDTVARRVALAVPRFSPGPYTDDKDCPHNRMPRIHADDGSLICEVGCAGTSQDRWEADARLLAAAPEMYDLLYEVTWITGPDGKPTPWMERELAVLARAAGVAA